MTSIKNAYCACSSKIIHTHPHGRSLEIPRGREVLKAKVLEVLYENKLEFLGGGGVQNKKPSMEGSMDIFWNCTLGSSLWSSIPP